MKTSKLICEVPFFVAVALLIAIAFEASAADVFLVRTDGVYKREVAFPPGSIVLGIGDTPPVPPPPSGATVREKVAALSKSLLTGIQAAPIAAIVKGMVGSDTPRASLAAAIKQLGDLPLFPGHKFDQWLSAVSALHDGEYTDAFLETVVIGITDAFTPAGGRRDVGAAFDFALILKILTCVIGELPAGADEEAKALNFLLIMKIITCVIGNLPGDAIAGEPTLAPLPDDSTSAILDYARDPRIRSRKEQAALMELAKTRGLVGAR